jgi:hypothetical protein
LEKERKKKKIILIFNTALLSMLAVLVIILFIGYKVIKNKAIYYLSNSTDLGVAIVIPEGFEADFPFKFTWKSIKVKFLQGTDLFFKNPKISIDPKLINRNELLRISVDSVYVKIIPSDSSTADIIEGPLSHLDLWLPFRISVNVKKVATDVKDVGKWSLDSLVMVKSGRQKRFYIIAKDIRGTHLAKNLFLNAEYRWNKSFSDASISISDRTSDSIAVMLNASRLRLEDLSAEIDAEVKNLAFWLKGKYPNQAPDIEKISLHSNTSVNILTGKAEFDLSLKTKIGKFWQLPAFDATITASGNNSGISQSEILLKGNNEESISFKGNIDMNLDGSGELEIKGIDITLGPETLPTDAKFHKIMKKGNSAFANFTTGAGSNFTARIADLDNPVITFSADIAPKEPWAVQWTGEMVKLENPTILTGSFSFKDVLLKANLKTRVPFAYHATADEFEVSLWLNSEGIHFPKGTIKRKGYESDFTGEVIWEKEYFKFKLNQSSGGEAEIYGTFIPKIDLDLKNINTLELPFADTTMLKGYNGLVSGNLSHNFEKKIGQASVSVYTAIQDLNVSAKSDVEIHGDSLFVKRIEIEQNEKKIKGSLFALLPSQVRKDFDVQRANLSIPDMNLVSLLALFNDSTLSSGYANGNLNYNKENGLRGEMILTKIALAGIDPSIVRFPNLYLEAIGDSVKMSNRVFLGDEGLWNGVLKVVITKPKDKGDFPFRISYEANNIGNEGKLFLNGFLSRNFKNILGDAQVQGDWFLPEGMGEIKNANINIAAKTVLGKHILDSLTANFNTGQNIYEMGILKIPFAFAGYVRKGMLYADTIFLYGQNDEKITVKLQLDLNKANIRDLSFNTKQFTLPLLNDHLIQVKNGTGNTKLDSAGITIFADLPAVYYNMKNSDYGTAEALLKGKAEYRFPFQTGQSKTNPHITGNFEISKAVYKKTLDLMPDPLHLDQSWKKFNKFLAPLLRDKKGSSVEKSASTSRPTDLRITVRTGSETAIINTNFAEFAFVVDVSITGTTRNILLSGDINAVSGGKIGYSNLTMFDLSSFRIYWRSMPVKQGEINLKISNDYKFCVIDGSAKDETCMVSIDVTGPLTRLSMQPSTNCDIEASPALIYYSMLLGCISEDYDSGSSFNRDRVAGKIIGKTMSSTINRIVGGNVIGDVDFKWKLLNDVKQEEDTNYVRVPVSLSKWIRNLEMVFGYTKTNENSLNPRYDNSYEIGLRYKLDVFDSTDINHNLIDPSVDISTNLVARHYISKTETTEDETRLEKNVGLVYKHKFWDLCILGFGYCKITDGLLPQ